MNDPVLIWSTERKRYWLPEARGYTSAVDQAGVYERARAEKHTATPENGAPYLGRLVEPKRVEKELWRLGTPEAHLMLCRLGLIDVERLVPATGLWNYEASLPTPEEVRAHEAQGGGWWQWWIPGSSAPGRCYKLHWDGEEIVSLGEDGEGHLYADVLSPRRWRPCTPDGTPCARASRKETPDDVPR